MTKGKKASAAAEAKPKTDAKNAVFEDDGEAITELKVNEKFAKEYMDRKRKEELTKLEKQRVFLEESDEDESESETEDEDAEELTAELDNDIKKTLRLIRNKDPIIYDSSVAFFKPNESDEEGGSDSDDGKKKATKKSERKSGPLYYKDLVRQQVIAGDVGSDDEDADHKPRVTTYGEEQAKLKQDFLKSLKQAEKSDDIADGAGEDDESDLEGGLFLVRTKSDAEKQQEEEDYEQFKSKYGSKLKKDTIDPEAFLENYLNGGWKEKKNEIPHYEDIVKEDEEDAEELEKMEDFEHAYNFRFEEEGSGLIQTYSRNIEDSMRRKDDKRKLKREERKERKALERLKKEEELRRLKNLKQADIHSKLEKIAKLVGKVSEEDRLQKVISEDLDGDFDPDAYDKRMQQIFDDQYYNEDDEVLEKPTWDDEEDKVLFANLPVDEDEVEDDEEDEEHAAPENSDVDDEVPAAHEGDSDHGNSDDGEEDANDDEEKYKNMSPEELERAKQKYLDELYGLDYEDLIGDLKCRFRYRQVHKNDFGLTAEEIMAADDKELKGLVSLKRIAPYMEEEYSVNRRKVKSFKKSLQEKQAEAAASNKKNKTKSEEIEQVETVATDAVQTKKRKRAKMSKQTTASEPDSTEKGDKETAVEDSDPADEAEEAKQEKKKSRRSKKKKVKHEPNPFAATGLSSSRLESYKLIKSKN